MVTLAWRRAARETRVPRQSHIARQAATADASGISHRSASALPSRTACAAAAAAVAEAPKYGMDTTGSTRKESSAAHDPKKDVAAARRSSPARSAGPGAVIGPP